MKSIKPILKIVFLEHWMIQQRLISQEISTKGLLTYQNPLKPHQVRIRSQDSLYEQGQTITSLICPNLKSINMEKTHFTLKISSQKILMIKMWTVLLNLTKLLTQIQRDNLKNNQKPLDYVIVMVLIQWSNYSSPICINHLNFQILKKSSSLLTYLTLGKNKVMKREKKTHPHYLDLKKKKRLTTMQVQVIMLLNKMKTKLISYSDHPQMPAKLILWRKIKQIMISWG